MNRCAAVVAFAVLAGLAAGAEGQANVLETLRARLHEADAVVLARCDAGTSAWEGSPRIIVTRHRCAVKRSFKGTAETVVPVAVLGGRVGSISMIASAGARLSAGADAVMLLRRSAFGPYYVVSGGAGGVVPVVTVNGEPTVRGMSLDAFARAVRQ